MKEPESGDMEAKETPAAAAELSSENIQTVIVTQGRLEEGEVVNLAMTEDAAFDVYERWMEALPPTYNGAVRTLAWAQERKLPLDTDAEPEAFR